MRSVLRRLTRPEAAPGRLFYAQVLEDPRLELEALAPGPNDTTLVISSGGCTALSFLASENTGTLVSVDRNTVQNHVVELKAAALDLPPADAILFLGGRPSKEGQRIETYHDLRHVLSDGARRYWDRRLGAIRRGVLGAGLAERFMGALGSIIRFAVHPRARIDRMLSFDSLDEQRAFYESDWNTRRWRALFPILLNQRVFRYLGLGQNRFYHGGGSSFAEHFQNGLEHSLKAVHARDNYFIHYMMTGHYPADEAGWPLYLNPDGARKAAEGRDRLTLVDGGVTEYLASREPRSIQRFALSNVPEWMSAAEIDALFAEVARTAAPGARVCFRNFVGFTEVPDRWRNTFVVDRRFENAITRDRSGVQRRIVVCDVVAA
ncbi:DUF3419 family protein [Pendulispora albinea]|uniref:BtaA family protein n=1 Tax=Pendulispora albinea TaxID=2741071 RepID=A0ABZ2M1R6_9BACT